MANLRTQTVYILECPGSGIPNRQRICFGADEDPLVGLIFVNTLGFVMIYMRIWPKDIGKTPSSIKCQQRSLTGHQQLLGPSVASTVAWCRASGCCGPHCNPGGRPDVSRSDRWRVQQKQLQLWWNEKGWKKSWWNIIGETSQVKLRLRKKKRLGFCAKQPKLGLKIGSRSPTSASIPPAWKELLLGPKWRNLVVFAIPKNAKVGLGMVVSVGDGFFPTIKK